MKPTGSAGAVVVVSQGVALVGSVPEGLISMAVGLVGVALARWVFVNKEQRRSGKRETWDEWLPLTLVAMLVSAVVIYDRRLGVSAAAFIGLGAGWAAVILLELMGERLTASIRAGLGLGPSVPPQKVKDAADASGLSGKLLNTDFQLPDDMREQLDRLDEQEENRPHD